MRSAQADALEGVRRAVPAVARREAGVDQRQLDVVQRIGARQQVERLENEADLLVPGSAPARRPPGRSPSAR